MTDQYLSTIANIGPLPKLAADLTYPGSQQAGTVLKVSGIDATSGLTAALSLTGKWAVNYLNFSALTAESITIKLTVDGTVVWNNTFTCGTTEPLLGGQTTDSNIVSEIYMCNSSFLLEIQTTSDTSIDLDYLARPIQ